MTTDEYNELDERIHTLEEWVDKTNMLEKLNRKVSFLVSLFGAICLGLGALLHSIFS